MGYMARYEGERRTMLSTEFCKTVLLEGGSVGERLGERAANFG